MKKIELIDGKAYWHGGKIEEKKLAELLIDTFAEEEMKHGLIKACNGEKIDDEKNLAELIKANEYWLNSLKERLVIGIFKSKEKSEEVYGWLNRASKEIYRKIHEKLAGRDYGIHKSTNTGVDIAVVQKNINLNLPQLYSWLKDIPVITHMDSRFPLYLNTPSKKRRGNIQISEVFRNPFLDIKSMPKDGWLIYPALMGGLLSFHAFPREFDICGFAQQNLFEIARPEDLGRKPDSILLYGVPNINRPVYFDDKDAGIVSAFVPNTELYTYFGYLKKPAVQGANIWALNNGFFPFHGMVIIMKIDDKPPFVLILIGDSMIGKSETAIALRILAKEKNLNIKIIPLVDDMGALNNELNILGWEIGGFVRNMGICLGEYDEVSAVHLNHRDADNPRMVVPLVDYVETVGKYKPNLVVIGDNFTLRPKDQLHLFNNAEEAFPHFWSAKRIAGGSVDGIDHSQIQESPCGNPFIGGRKEEYYKRTFEYLQKMEKAGIKLGKLHTKLTIDELFGPKMAAKDILEYILIDTLIKYKGKGGEL